MHDVHFEIGGLSAQIDYIVVTRKVTFVIECKNLIGNIDIDSEGNFIRDYELNGKHIKEGIYSPATQNQRHLEILRQIRRDSKSNIVSKMLFDKYDLFVNLFGEEYVDKYLLRYKLSEITDEYDHLKQYRHGIPQKAVLLKEDVIKYKVIPPARKKETRVVCDVYMIPSPYQGLKHSEIIRKIFADKYPWISEFSYKVYEIRSEIDDFYVNVNEKDSFYVPLKDFMEGNVQNIKNSNYRRLGDALYKNETIMKFLKYIETNKEETHNE
jgi:hypothetical protein